MDVKKRFESKFLKASSGCWDWLASCTNAGYGRFQTTSNGKHKVMLAHRMSYLLYKGPIPPSMCICHTCDNARCVNPDHLYAGTGWDNLFDRVTRSKRSTRRTIEFYLSLKEAVC